MTELRHEQLYLPANHQRLQMSASTTILDEVSVFPNAYFSLPSDYYKAMEQSLLENLDTTSVYVAFGEPLSAKLSLLTEVRRKLQRFNRSVRRRDLKVKDYLLTWGDAFAKIPSRNLPADMDWRKKSEIQTREAAPVFFDELAELLQKIQRERRPKEVHRIWFDLVANSGFIHNGVVYGLPRAFYEMGELAQGSGRFAGMEYSSWMFGVAASKAVREKNRTIRGNVQDLKDPEVKAAYLRSSGKTIHFDDPARLAQYGEDEASPNNALEIEGEVNETIVGLSENKLIDLSGYEIDKVTLSDFSDPYKPITFFRDEIVGGRVNPYFLKYWGIDPRKAVCFYNQKPVKKTVLDMRGFSYPMRGT